ncbi:hypothetical protein TNCV_448201 [Trichonephila clavipes]|nr:hypothetical protein TNCV_448201 [Trichonephila clavipes]
MSEYHTGDSTIWFGSTPILRENTLGVVMDWPPIFVPLPPNSREDLLLKEYLECHRAAQALYVYKNPCLLRDSRIQDIQLSSQLH